DVNRIHTKDGNIWTSAGMTAGIDLALVLIEDDFDFQVAKNVARDLVVYHRRPGGQSQYSAMLEMEPESRRIKDVLYYIKKH
ncbi:GlxA family transcriptional regulator, partial [Salmonella enterica]